MSAKHSFGEQFTHRKLVFDQTVDGKHDQADARWHSLFTVQLFRPPPKHTHNITCQQSPDEMNDAKNNGTLEKGLIKDNTSSASTSTSTTRNTPNKITTIQTMPALSTNIIVQIFRFLTYPLDGSSANHPPLGGR